jgi:hypothetical protein
MPSEVMSQLYPNLELEIVRKKQVVRVCPSYREVIVDETVIIYVHKEECNMSFNSVCVCVCVCVCARARACAHKSVHACASVCACVCVREAEGVRKRAL